MYLACMEIRKQLVEVGSLSFTSWDLGIKLGPSSLVVVLPTDSSGQPWLLLILRQGVFVF